LKFRVVIVLLFLFTSCHPLFCRWQNGYSALIEEPTKESLIGKYELSRKSKSFLNDSYDVWPVRIELTENMKYKLLFEENPSSLGDTIFSNDRDLNETKKNVIGKWSTYFNKKDKYCLIELEGLTVEPLFEKNNNFAISITIGDGDNCEGIMYEKIKK